MLKIHPEIQLSNNQKKAFKGIDMIGFSLAEMPGVLALNPEQFKAYKMKGIPVDSVKNELAEWAFQTRYVDPEMKVALKGDKKSNVKAFNDVVNTITEKVEINKINLITTLSGSSQKQVNKEEATEK
ncbi:MAG: hypothetical protein JNM67_12085 [Bacteroidetes bacterium]|nr:hypothetical protein [Bacteroidota bacterium]